ncbi:MAG: exopolysaccharide biosynthesis polyprenyl glycosylphosphotransferase [Patescibacteria group bacterium]
MKRSELAFNIVSIPTDALMLLLAGAASFYLRGKSTQIVGPVLFELRLSDFISAAYRLIPVLLVVFAFLGLYNLRGTRKFASEFGRVLVGVSLGLLLVMLLFFFDQTIFPSRFIILATWGLGILFVSTGRLVLKDLQEFTFSKNIGLHRLAVVNGHGNNTQIIEKFFKNTAYGYEIIKELDFGSGIFNDLEELYASRKIDEILQANTSLSDEDNLKLVEFARNKGLGYSFVPNLFNVQRNSVETANLNGVPVISLKNTPLDGWGKVAKRVLDIVSSFACLIITFPITLFIYIAIKMDSRGRAIYTAVRGGRGKDFKFYKFRTMHSHLSVGEQYGGEAAHKVRQELWKQNDRGDEYSPFLKIKNDPRVTRVGRFLRRSKLDEIPQFWNVLIGDMSMVGPRAHVVEEVGRYRSRYQRMFSIKPGVFGISQNAQFSWPDLPFDEEIRLNIFYIENWSLWLDIKVLAKSFWILFFARTPKADY